MSAFPPPTKTFTTRLDFQGKPYDVFASDPLKLFNHNVSRVREHIKERLYNYTGLNALVKLTLGDGPQYSSPPIFIDSRSAEPKLLSSAPKGVEPDISANIMPERVLDVIEGRMHATHAFYKHARPPYQGPFAWCFAPLGRPAPTIGASELDLNDLPKPTEDIEQVKRDIRKWGYGFVASALSPEQVKILRTAVEEQAAGERKDGVAHIDNDHKQPGDQPNQRVWNLPNKGEEFLDLLNHPLIDAIMPWFLGSTCTVHSMSVNIVQCSDSGIYMHRDQIGFSPETVDTAYVLGSMWYLVDVNEERGATRMYPGSHNKNVAPESINTVGGSIPASGPAGTCLVLDSRIWHSTGINTTDTARPVILLAFCRSYIRQLENYQLLLSEETKAKLRDRQRALLGLPAAHHAKLKASRPGTEGVGKLRLPCSAEH